MKAGIQRIASEVGEAGCYAFCIMELAERITGKSIDVLKAFIDGVNAKCIYYNFDKPEDPDNCTVTDAGRFLTLLTGRKYIHRYESDKNKLLKAGELIVERWERKATGKTYGHFVLADWDPLGNSLTRRSGYWVSNRVFTPA
jgi:hypothetical protein